MNEEHLKLCSSAEWAETVQKWIIPWVLDGVELGENVLEVGPGPGLTTDVLRRLVPRLTAVEVDPDLAAALSQRLAGTNVAVIHADASDTSLPAGGFSGAICLTMLHHVHSPELQDAVFAEVHRLLAPDAVFAGEDSLDSPELRELHHDDTYVPMDPVRLPGRLADAGFSQVEVSTNEHAVRFRAVRTSARQVG